MRSASGIPPARTGTVSPGPACAVSKPGASLRDEVVGGRARERARAPERRHDPDHERRLHHVNALPVESERHGPGRGVVVDHDVCAREERGAPLAPFLGLEVEDDRPLAAVQRDEVAPEARGDRHDVAIAVARRRLDLDHLGAEIAEDHAAQRACDVLRVLHDAHSGERRSGHSSSPRRAITSCCTSAVPPEIVEPTDAR